MAAARVGDQQHYADGGGERVGGGEGRGEGGEGCERLIGGVGRGCCVVVIVVGGGVVVLWWSPT